jgi:hypothetical protein
LQPGEYYLAVMGVGNGDPSIDGYSQYASLGQFTIQGTIQSYLGDVNSDISVNADDIDALRIAIVAGQDDPLFDLNSDGLVNRTDIDELVYNILQTNYGDANLDGFVDASDFNIWNENKFKPGFGWAKGDFNGDFAIDASDFNIWSVNRFTSAPVAAAALVGHTEFAGGSRSRSHAALSRAVAARDAQPPPTVAMVATENPTHAKPSGLSTSREVSQHTDASVNRHSAEPFIVPRYGLRRLRLFRRGPHLSSQAGGQTTFLLVDAVYDTELDRSRDLFGDL